MNPTQTLPALAAIGPPLFAIVPLLPVLIGAGFVALVLRLASGDEAEAAAAPATEPPAAAPPPAKPGFGWTFFDILGEEDAVKPAAAAPPRRSWGEEVDAEWGFFTDQPRKPAPAPPPVAAEMPREITEEERAARRVEKAEAALTTARNSRNRLQAAAHARPAAAALRDLAAPVVAMQARPAAPVAPAPSPVPTLTAATAALATAPRAAAATESVSAGSKPGVAAAAPPPGASRRPQPNPPKVTRADLAAIFDNGATRLTRQAAVAALKARGVGQTAAYTALRQGGRFAAVLDAGVDGLLGLRPSI